MIPESEYITVERSDPGYGDRAVSVESIALHHGPGARENFAKWWETGGRLDNVRFLAALPDETAGVYVEDYLDWANQFDQPSRKLEPKCRWCKDAGVITINFKTKPCVDCQPLESRVMAWIDGNDTGTSSETIWHILTQLPGKVFKYGFPRDADDFGRCARLIEFIPEWATRLGEVAERCSEWKPIVANWDRLTDLYACGEARKLDALLDWLMHG